MRECEEKESQQKMEDYKICDVKITNDGLIQSSTKIGTHCSRMITIRSLTENKIIKEFTINLPEMVTPKEDQQKDGEKDENEEDDTMDLYEFMEYHNGYLYVKINENTPMRVYDVECNLYYIYHE